MKCAYCGAENAEYYNELLEKYYCRNCSQKGREEWLDLLEAISKYLTEEKTLEVI